MISSHMMEDYRRMNFADRTTFRRWLTASTVIVAFVLTLIAMIAINGLFWSGELGSTNSAGTVEQVRPK